jgi:hypothetical protein
MILEPLFERFVTASPVSVLARGLLERALNGPALNDLFERLAERQYTRDLLFSTCVDLMAAVVSRQHRTINAAYVADPDRVGVTVPVVYEKLARMEPNLAAEVVRHTARRLTPLIRDLNGTLPAPVPGYRTKILDGNHLEKTQRRLKALRDVAAGPLPGQTLCVYDPQLDLVIDVVPCEDGHAQERSLMPAVFATIVANDLWVADRNFCTTGILFGIAAKQAFFVIRQHGSTLVWHKEGKRRYVGTTETGTLYEQTLWLENPAVLTADGRPTLLLVRRVILVLNQPTTDGETEIVVLTNLPRSVAAVTVANVYRGRWKIEGVFQHLTVVLRCEVNTLGYPKAALFGYCVAVASRNVYAAVQAALRGAFGVARIEEHVSATYMADEIKGKYEGMMIAIPAEHWQVFAVLETSVLAVLLLQIARGTNLKRFQKHKRGPKKPRSRRTRYTTEKHIATARLLNGTMKTKKRKNEHP